MCRVKGNGENKAVREKRLLAWLLELVEGSLNQTAKQGELERIANAVRLNAGSDENRNAAFDKPPHHLQITPSRNGLNLTPLSV